MNISPEEASMTDPANAARRRFLIAGAATALGVAAGSQTGAAQQNLAPTPACGDDHGPTVRQTEGPFFKPRSPQRSDLREVLGNPGSATGF